MKPKSSNNQLDAMNLRILGILNANSRASYSEIAEKLACSVNSARDRILAMERRGVILGYRAVVDETKLGRPIHAVIFLSGPGPVPAAVIEELRRHDWVRQAWRGAGQYRIVVECVGANLERLNERVREAVQSTELQIAWSTQLAPCRAGMAGPASEPRLSEPTLSQKSSVTPTISW